MKLNKEPLKQIPPSVVRKDMQYWRHLVGEFLSNPSFCRDSLARKSFSKLRSSIGRLYAWRGMFHEAEIAFHEALDLYDASAEARTGLATVLMTQLRTEEAIRICEEWCFLDPLYPGAMETLREVLEAKEIIKKETEYQSLYASCKDDPEFIFRYVDVLKKRNKTAEVDKLLNELLEKNPDPIHWQQALNFYASFNQMDRVEKTLQLMTKKNPKYPLAWYNLAVIHAALQRGDEACLDLGKALQLDTNMVNSVRADSRFTNLRAIDAFQKLVK